MKRRKLTAAAKAKLSALWTPERREAARVAALERLAGRAGLVHSTGGDNYVVVPAAPAPRWTLYAVTGRPVPLMGSLPDESRSEAGRERIAREILRVYPTWGPLRWSEDAPTVTN